MLMDAASASEGIESRPGQSQITTLLDLVAALVDSGMNDLEVVQSVTRLLNSRRVRLIGQLREAHPEVPEDGRFRGLASEMISTAATNPVTLRWGLPY